VNFVEKMQLPENLKYLLNARDVRVKYTAPLKRGRHSEIYRGIFQNDSVAVKITKCSF
jgi:hypothetical protein